MLSTLEAQLPTSSACKQIMSQCARQALITARQDLPPTTSDRRCLSYVVVTIPTLREYVQEQQSWINEAPFIITMARPRTERNIDR